MNLISSYHRMDYTMNLLFLNLLVHRIYHFLTLQTSYRQLPRKKFPSYHPWFLSGTAFQNPVDLVIGNSIVNGHECIYNFPRTRISDFPMKFLSANSVVDNDFSLLSNIHWHTALQVMELITESLPNQLKSYESL